MVTEGILDHHDGFLASGDFRHKTFLCPAYKKIFAHIEHRLQENDINI
jgi:hypothetical protein